MNTLTKKELESIKRLISLNENSKVMQGSTNLSYLGSISLGNKISRMLTEIEGNDYLESKMDNYNVSFDYDGEQSLDIEDVLKEKTYKIPLALLHDGKIAEYNIIDRENEIDEIERMIGETHMMGSNVTDSDRELMREDLETLKDSDEEYVIANYSTNGFITKAEDIEAFNNACKMLIDSYNLCNRED